MKIKLFVFLIILVFSFVCTNNLYSAEDDELLTMEEENKVIGIAEEMMIEQGYNANEAYEKAKKLVLIMKRNNERLEKKNYEIINAEKTTTIKLPVTGAGKCVKNCESLGDGNYINVILETEDNSFEEYMEKTEKEK